MKKIEFKSIYSRLMFWLILMAVLPLSASIIITYIQRVDAAEMYSIEKIAAIRELKVARLKNWVNESIGSMSVMSGDNEVRGLENILSKKTKTINDLKTMKIAEELLHRNLKNDSRFSELFIINATTGLVEISTDTTQVGKNKFVDMYYTEPIKTGEHYIKPIYFSEFYKSPQQTFSTPIYCLAHGIHFTGILVGRINLGNSIYEIMHDKVGLGETGETLIVNKDVVALNELRWYKNAPLKLQIKAKPAIWAADGRTGVVAANDYRGTEVLAAYTYIEELGWGFISKQDMYEVKAPIREMKMEFALLFGASILIILAITSMLAKSISKPIIALETSAKKIGSDTYIFENVVTSKDEIGSLANSIKYMTESLHTKINIQDEISTISGLIINQVSLESFAANLINHLHIISKSDEIVFYVLNELSGSYVPISAKGIEQEMLKDVKIENANSEFEKWLARNKIFELNNYYGEYFLNISINQEAHTAKEVIALPILVDNINVAFVGFSKNTPFSNEFFTIIEQSSTNINACYSSLIANIRVGILAENVFKTNDELDRQSKELSAKNIILHQEKNNAEQANKELDAFSYSVSHDLRAPLRAIDGFTNMLMEDYADKLDDEGIRIGHTITNNAKKMGELIDELLSFSRMGKAALKKSPIDLNVMVNDIYNQTTTEEKRKKIVFTVSALPKIMGDPAMIRQLWINLISNAIKYSSNKKKSIINIDCTQEMDDNIYSITDNGAGFDMKYIDKIFGVFQRLHSDKEFKGNGVGLAIAQRIVNRHMGTLWAVGKKAHGASFYVKLPKMLKLKNEQ